jgi:hypothetical protein
VLRSLILSLFILGTVAKAQSDELRLVAASSTSSPSPSSPPSSSTPPETSEAPAASNSSNTNGENKAEPKADPAEELKPDTKPSKAVQKPDSDPVYQTAVEHFRAGRIPEAGKILKTMNKDPDQRDKAALLIGTIYYQKKKFKRAKKYFDRVAEPVLTKDTAYAYGSTYLESEEFDKALKGLRLNLKIRGPKRALTRFKVAVVYFKRSQLTRAERYFEATSPKTLPKTQRLERQRYLTEIRQRHDELLSSFGFSEGDVQDTSLMSKDFEGMSSDDDWSANAQASTWSIRWKPAAMLKQESNQNLNRAHGRDGSDLIVHRVGTKAYAGGDPNAKMFGSLEFGAGFTGYDVKTDQSRSFGLPGISGQFLSQTKEQHSEENSYVSFKPLLNMDISQTIRAEIGAGYEAFLPHFEMSQSWGQSEIFARVRAEGKEIDGGLELALQQPFDEASHSKSNDMLLKADINQRLGEMSLRLNVQDWRSDNIKFTAFDRNRMYLVDNRFKYHLGFKSETKLGVSGAITFGELALRASYDFTSRNSDIPLERLNAVDDPETVAKEANKRMFALSYPIWDSMSLMAAAGTQNLSAYTYRVRDPLTKAVTREYSSDVVQTIYQLGLQVSLVDWVKIKINYALGKYKYVSRSAEEEAFQAANPRENQNSVMSIELSKSF